MPCIGVRSTLSGGFPSEHILLLRYRLKVGKVHAPPVSTCVIKREAGLQDALHDFIQNPVSRSNSALMPEHSIAGALVDCSGPSNAARLKHLSLGVELHPKGFGLASYDASR